MPRHFIAACAAALIITACQLKNEPISPSLPPIQPSASLPTLTSAPSEPTPIVATDAATAGVIETPAQDATVPAALVEITGAVLPPGFSLIKFADLYRPTSLAFDAQGRLYATSFDGTVHVFTDADGNGRADSDVIATQGFDTALGIVIDPATGNAYISSKGLITLVTDSNGDGIPDQKQTWMSDLPASGRHQNDNLKFGPDGWLYMGIGSTCDACQEANPLSATIVRINPQTKEREIIATGLRNPFDIAFDPQTGALFATDNGRDDLGEDVPLEELNHIVPGEFYGWPNCWDTMQGMGCQGAKQAIAFFDPRSSVDSLVFYNGTRFPAEYQGNLFAAVFGSFEVNVARGIWRVKLTPSGDTYTAQPEWFVQWPDGWLLGMTLGPDGALYVGDYINGGVYRISYGLP